MIKTLSWSTLAGCAYFPIDFPHLRTPRRTMMTSSNGNIFCVTGPLCGEFTGPGEFPAQRPVTRSFDVFFYLRLNKRLSKQSWGWWFETPPWSLWRQCNADHSQIDMALSMTLNAVKTSLHIIGHVFRNGDQYSETPMFLSLMRNAIPLFYVPKRSGAQIIRWFGWITCVTTHIYLKHRKTK